MKKILLLAILMWFSSCEKDTKPYNLNGVEYPTGISVVNLTAQNDCSLPKCSDKRIKRLKANGVRALANNDSTLQMTLTFDSVIQFRTCEKLDSSLLLSLDTIPWISFSGDIYDACGIVQYDWPIEEYYIVKIRSIEKF